MAEEKETKAEVVNAEVIDDKNVLKLSKPMSNGVDTLIFDFDKINGYALLKCEKRAKKEDPAINYLPFSQVYQAFVAAYAAGVKFDDILTLSGGDFINATTRAQAFLMNVGK